MPLGYFENLFVWYPVPNSLVCSKYHGLSAHGGGPFHTPATETTQGNFLEGILSSNGQINVFALMEWMFQLATPGTVYPDLLTWLCRHAALGELPQPFCMGISFLSPSPLPVTPTRGILCH